MSFNLESSRNSEINELPEVEIDKEQLSKTEETAENFDDCFLDEVRDSKENDVGADSLEEAKEDYDDCEAKVGNMEQEHPELAEDDYDDFNDCGRNAQGQYAAEVTYTTDGEIGQEEAEAQLQEAYDACDDPEDMQQLKENINENEHIQAEQAEVVERPENPELKDETTEAEYEAAQKELDEAQESLEAQQEAAQEYQDNPEKQINDHENELPNEAENIDETPDEALENPDENTDEVAEDQDENAEIPDEINEDTEKNAENVGENTEEAPEENGGEVPPEALENDENAENAENAEPVDAENAEADSERVDEDAEAKNAEAVADQPAEAEDTKEVPAEDPENVAEAENAEAVTDQPAEAEDTKEVPAEDPENATEAENAEAVADQPAEAEDTKGVPAEDPENVAEAENAEAVTDQPAETEDTKEVPAEEPENVAEAENDADASELKEAEAEGENTDETTENPDEVNEKPDENPDADALADEKLEETDGSENKDAESDTKTEETDAPCPKCGQNPCVCHDEANEGDGGPCPKCGQDPCICHDEVNEGNGGPCPKCGQDPCICPKETNGDSNDGAAEQVCPVCGKYPCVCKALDGGEGYKKIEKLEDLSFDQINTLSQSPDGRQYLQHLHAEMVERVSAEHMGMTVEEYREHKRKIADYQNTKVEVPPHSPSDVERAAMAAAEQAQSRHEAFQQEYFNGASKKRLGDLNNIISSQIPELQKHERLVAGELNAVNDQIAMMYSNDEHLTDRENYALLCQKREALEACSNKLRGQIAMLSADMYDCCQQTGEKYTHMGEKLRAEDQQAVLGNAREVLDKGVSSKEDVIGAFQTSEKIRHDVMPSLDAELKENNSVAMLVENSQKQYLAENHMTHEQAMRDPNSEYARNAKYLDALAAERTAIEAKMLEADRIQHQLTEKLPVAGEPCKVEVKDLKNGTIEITYTWDSGIKQTTREGQRHDSDTKVYYRGTERKETYTVGRDDSALYGHKYAVKYRGVGFEREDTFKRGEAKITNKLEGGLLNGSLEQGYLRDIDTGKMKASLDAAVSVAELKDTLTTTVNGKEYTIAAAEVAVGKGEVGYKVDEHGVALTKPEASAFGAKVTIGATELEHGANPFEKPSTVDEAFTKFHDGLEKKKEFEDIAKGEWGEDARGETVIRGETPKSLEERMQDALKSDSITAAELKQLRDEGNEKLRQLQEARQATEQERQGKFAAVSAMPRGTDEFKKALQEHNALQDQKMMLDEQVADLKKQQALLEEKTDSMRQAQQSEVEKKALLDWFGRKKPEVTEIPVVNFGNYEVDSHGFVKGENYQSYIKDWEGYSADRYKTEMFDQAREQTISPALVEGIRVSDNDIENPDIFWSQHEPGGTVESFEKIAANIPEVRDRLAAGESLKDLMEDERLGSCAAIYFHPSNMPEVIKCGDYYEFQSNGRHRILAARNLGYDIPVRVVGECTIQDLSLTKKQSLTDSLPNSSAAGDGSKKGSARLSGSVPFKWDEGQWGPDPLKPKDSPPRNALDSQKYTSIVNSLEKRSVEYRPIQLVSKLRSDSEIVDYLGGGDLTTGSCSSLAFAYAGNKAGYDVLDFRGGDSLDYFSSNDSIRLIAELPGVNSHIIEGRKDVECANQLLLKMEPGKEYYLGVAQHSAIVRKMGSQYEYLELQSPINNGWHTLDDNVLVHRFGCSKHILKYPNFLIDVESLSDCQEFRDVLGFINTADSAQKKGSTGHVR